MLFQNFVHRIHSLILEFWNKVHQCYFLRRKINYVLLGYLVQVYFYNPWQKLRDKRKFQSQSSEEVCVLACHSARICCMTHQTYVLRSSYKYIQVNFQPTIMHKIYETFLNLLLKNVWASYTQNPDEPQNTLPQFQSCSKLSSSHYNLFSRQQHWF